MNKAEFIKQISLCSAWHYDEIYSGIVIDEIFTREVDCIDCASDQHYCRINYRLRNGKWGGQCVKFRSYEKSGGVYNTTAQRIKHTQNIINNLSNNSDNS